MPLRLNGSSCHSPTMTRRFPPSKHLRVRSELTERFGGVMALTRGPAEGLRRKTAGRFATSTLRGGMATGAALTGFEQERVDTRAQDVALL